jgi:hypothetical protein
MTCHAGNACRQQVSDGMQQRAESGCDGVVSEFPGPLGARTLPCALFRAAVALFLSQT